MTYREQRLLRQKTLSATDKIVKAKQLRAEGLSNKEIAEELKCSIHTVINCCKSETLISKQESLRKSKPAKLKRIRKNSSIAKSGITLEQYNKLFIEQEGKCGICGTHQKDLHRTLVVNQDFETGEILGLVCSTCKTHSDNLVMLNQVKANKLN